MLYIGDFEEILDHFSELKENIYIYIYIYRYIFFLCLPIVGRNEKKNENKMRWRKFLVLQ